ncbi:MAG TPA: hypothetical protein VIW24_32670 [Aldersonia sp.]
MFSTTRSTLPAGSRRKMQPSVIDKIARAYLLPVRDNMPTNYQPSFRRPVPLTMLCQDFT